MTTMFTKKQLLKTKTTDTLYDCMLLLGGIVILSLLVAGCGSVPATKVINESKVIYKPIPAYMLSSCLVTQPIPKEEYLAKDFVQKEIYLTNYSIDLLKDIGNCNNQIKAIEKFNTEHSKLYKD